MVDDAVIRKVIGTLLATAPGSAVFLFGSYAQGNARPHSDLDLLVVEPGTPNRIAEMFRLRKAVEAVLAPYLIPVDVVVMSRDRFEHWKDTPNTLAHAASRTGKLYESVG
ncbi:MAG TPA: nucleotidyltransferase domain-containing protein [Candidatus Brocadiia bacterium]|nr:nucleotidyltransferase domain-containing protein [Candidatus Brocadiia bacterium]